MMSTAKWLKIGGALQNALVALNELEEDAEEGAELDMARQLGKDGASMLARVMAMLHTEHSRRDKLPCRRCATLGIYHVAHAERSRRDKLPCRRCGGEGVTISGQICGLCLSA